MSIRPVNEDTDEEATLFFELKLAFETPLKLGANTTIPSSLRRPFFYRSARQRLQGHLLGDFSHLNDTVDLQLFSCRKDRIPG